MKRRIGLTLGLWLLGCPSAWAEDAPKPDKPAVTEQTPRKVVRDCALSLWGCQTRAGISDSQQYDQILHNARSQLVFGQIAPGTDPYKLNEELIDATRTYPERPEAWLLLAVAYAEQGACDAGFALMQRMLSSDADSPVEHRLRDKQALRLGIALCQTRRGEPDLAIAQYRRMLLAEGPSHRVLYRLGDALMAQGRLEEAIAHYSQACLDLPSLQPLVNVARSCAGLMAALDRTRRQRPLRLMMQLRRADLGLRFLQMSDFVPKADRDYYQALLRAPSCEREWYLVSYLQAAPATTPHTYLRRAEELLSATRAQVPGCAQTGSSSSTGPIKEPQSSADGPGLPTDAL